jgi:SPP1 gp7 family putative phage head morphogenesis protein
VALKSRFAARAKKRQRARVPRRAARYAKAPRPPAGAELAYRTFLAGVVKTWAKRGTALLLPAAAAITERTDAKEGAAALASLKAYGNSLARSSGPLIGATAKKIDRGSRVEFDRLGIKVRDAEPWLERTIPHWRDENIGLIKTLFSSQTDKLSELLEQGEGRRYESLAKDIESRFGITVRHADLIARDQTLKLNAQITQGRMLAVGIEKYIWTTTGDERVRPMHEDLDGETFSWDDPPVTNEQGDRNHPGEDYQCRCVAYPVIPELDEAPAPEDGSPAEEPTTPEPIEPATPEDATVVFQRADELIDALEVRASGRLVDAEGARDLLRDQVQQTFPGAVLKKTGQHAAIAVDANLKKIGAAGSLRVADGYMRVAPGIADDARRALKLIKSRGYNPDNPSHKQWIDALQTFVHEELHAHSLASGTSLHGIGLVLEEVGTELNARRVLNEIEPLTKRGHPFRAYDDYINKVVNIVSAHAEISSEVAQAATAAAHERAAITATREPFAAARDVLDAWAAELPVTKDQRSAIVRDLQFVGPKLFR